MRAIRPLAVAALSCGALLGAAIPASATPATAAGAGREVHTAVDSGLYSGPGLSTPRIGTVWAGDNFAAICRVNDNNGKRLLLGIERPGRNGVQWANTAGYVWDDDVIGDTADLPSCDGYGRRVTPNKDTAMYAGPGLSTGQIGTAWAGDDVAGVCKINDNNGKRLVLGIERPGRNGVQWANTVGYVWDLDIRESTGDLPDCGTA
ncbi:hypothetical protein [Streptomyces sp. NPDC050485]|uniref:hypothetical protein n=1 Tax=Streptomyces sp. NPDC050485 TaxID=3365617 RepID=UPI0037B0E74A